MNILNKTFSVLVVTLTLFCTMPVAQAATYNFTIDGLVYDGAEANYNAYGLFAGDTITATGTFTANLGTIGSETGTVSFATGNTMTIDLNGTLLFASDDVSGNGASLTFSSGSLTDFDFLKTSSPAFNSSFVYFDDYDSLFGEWTNTSLTVVPVPAAVWLFGSGLLGLGGAAFRRRKQSVQ